MGYPARQHHELGRMDIFRFRNHLTHDYAEYVRSFIRVATPDVKTVVDAAIEDQVLWPEPIVQLNPAFEPGASRNS